MRLLLFPGLRLTGFVLIVLAACRGDEKSTCPTGMTDAGGVCRCDAGLYEVHGQNFCRALAADEYFGTSADCTCGDSAFYKFGAMFIDQPTGKTVVPLEITPGGRDGATPEAGTLYFYYYDQPDGAFLSGIDYQQGCTLNGQLTHRRWYAKFTSATTLTLWETRETTSAQPQRDTCTWQLRR